MYALTYVDGKQKEELKNATRRALKAAGALDYDSDESNDCSVDSNSLMSKKEAKEITLHTRLTTEKGIKLYRQIMLNMMKVYVKVGGVLLYIFVCCIDCLISDHAQRRLTRTASEPSGHYLASAQHVQDSPRVGEQQGQHDDSAHNKGAVRDGCRHDP
jgi:hypothetical protein